jgi:hypothetical protein
MSSTGAPTPPPYSLVPRPPTPWIDIRTGQPTIEFYRFIVYLFQSAGSGQANTNLAKILAELTALTNEFTTLNAEFSSLNDYVQTTREVDLSPLENVLGQLVSYVMTGRTLSSTVSGLQNRTASLEDLILTQRA